MGNPTRLIVFMELVRGCNNVDCPSWGVVCKYGTQKSMTMDTLKKVNSGIAEALDQPHPFEVVDLWTYGCGDSLDHPELPEMLKAVREDLGHLGKISMAIDSRRDMVEGNWWKYLDKVKIIHKLPDTFDWVSRAKYWSKLPIKMSHKLITNKLTNEMWDIWKNSGFITELKAVPWHDIELGTERPTLTKRNNIVCETGFPSAPGPYPGRPVRRAMINWDGSLRRCLVNGTQHISIKDLFLGDDEVCKECFPLTGGGLAKFYENQVTLTPSATCVSDGYFQPTWED
jgi:hypothetical protein